MQKLNDYCLRPMRDEDLELVLKWRNSEHVCACMFTDHIISEEEHYTWFDKHRATSSLNIFTKAEKPLGVVNITHIDDKNRRAFWGFYLGEENLPRGTGTIMGYLGLKLAFSELKIRKLCSEVIIGNEVSLKFHKKLGFKEEGCLHKHVLKGKTYKDVIPMALFADDWKKLQTKIRKTICE